MARKSPIYEIRFGFVKAAIWKNETENGPWYNVTISRFYKQGNEWKDATSFGRDDLLLVAKAADVAHTWICEQSRNER